MISDLPSILSKLKSLKPDLLSEFGVQGIFVFGSYARGEATPASDLDILLDVDPSARLTYFKLARLEARLEAEIGIPVDVVTRGGLNPRFAPYIEPTLVAA